MEKLNSMSNDIVLLTFQRFICERYKYTLTELRVFVLIKIQGHMFFGYFEYSSKPQGLRRRLSEATVVPGLLHFTRNELLFIFLTHLSLRLVDISQPHSDLDCAFQWTMRMLQASSLCYTVMA